MSIIPVAVQVPDAYSTLYSWGYYGAIGEGEGVQVYAWTRFSFQFTGDNVGDCELDIYGSNEGLAGLCWGLLATLTMPIKDRMHDPHIDNLDPRLKFCRAYKPIVRGTPDPGNNLAVNLFCSKLF
jgi:hypothetical protein